MGGVEAMFGPAGPSPESPSWWEPQEEVAADALRNTFGSL